MSRGNGADVSLGSKMPVLNSNDPKRVCGPIGFHRSAPDASLQVGPAAAWAPRTVVRAGGDWTRFEV